MKTKLCINCKHAKINGLNNSVFFSCSKTAKKIPAIEDFVTGRPVTLMANCTLVRYDESLCGKKGKWFESLIKEPLQ